MIDPTADAVSDPGTAPEATAPAAVGQPERTYTRKDVDAAYAEARRWAKQQEQRIRQEYEGRKSDLDPAPIQARALFSGAERRAAAKRRLARPAPSPRQ